jgi:hypothetical protein
MKLTALRVLPFFLAFCSTPSFGQTAAKPAGKPAATPTKAGIEKIDLGKAQKMVNRVLKETSSLRGLAVKHPVKTKVMTRNAIEKMLSGKVTTEMTNRQLLASELFLRQLGLAPADFKLKSTYIQMMGEQIAGFYEARTNTFTTSDRVDPLQLETIMAHELTHALQDQHFDLARLEKWPLHDSDARIAMSALVEGDATLVMSRYMAKNPFRFLGTLVGSLRSQADSPTFNAAPRMLREGVTFPYVGGLQFVTNIYQSSGWKGVSNAYSVLPQSTEQILHFEKYMADEEPLKVGFKDLTKKLGSGWSLLDHDVNGELGLFLVLVEHLTDEAAAKNAAAGWGGDRYSVYQGPKGAALVAQDTRWDSVAEANQWRAAYVQNASNRMGVKVKQQAGRAVWSNGKSGIWMEQRGNRVLILEGAVGSFNPNTLFAALWQ